MINRIKSVLVLLSLIMIVAVPIFWIGMDTGESKAADEIERLNNKINSDRTSYRQKNLNDRLKLQESYINEVAKITVMCKGAAQEAVQVVESVSESEKAQTEAVQKAVKGKR